jgi:hypothetical protein
MKKILCLCIAHATLVQLPSVHAQLSGSSLDVGSGNSFWSTAGYDGFIGSGNTVSAHYFPYGMASLQIGNSNFLEDVVGVLSVGDSNYGTNTSRSTMIGLGNSIWDSTTMTVIGSFNSVGTANDALVVGSYNNVTYATGPLLVVGLNNSIWTNNTFVFGTGLMGSYNSTTLTLVGHYNDPNVYGSVFAIGNGSDDSNRRNAFEVYQNGDVIIPGGKLSVFATPSSTSGIVLDAAAGQITINGQTLLAPSASGFVGIGTSAPIAKLDVRGAVSVGTPAHRSCSPIAPMGAWASIRHLFRPARPCAWQGADSFWVPIPAKASRATRSHCRTTRASNGATIRETTRSTC